MKIIDAIGVSLIIIGITLTALSFIAARGPSTEVRSVTVEEIPTPPPPIKRFGQKI